MAKVLVFDTETTGLPKNWKAPMNELDNWPRLVQIAWVQSNTQTGEKREFCYIIRPDGFTIPEEASRVHRVTTERAMQEGRSLRSVLDVFGKRVQEADVIAAHNIEFDKNVTGAEFLRLGMGNLFEGKRLVCTMHGTTKFVGAKNKRGGSKWPTNMELYKKLFNEEFEGAHDALEDVKATDRCFWECAKRGILDK